MSTLTRDQYDRDIALLRKRTTLLEKLTGVLRCAAVGHRQCVRHWRGWLKQAGWRRLVEDHEHGEHSPVVGTGNWTIAKRAGRIEGDVAGPLASLLNQLAREMYETVQSTADGCGAG